MVKKIILILDQSKAGQEARQYAFHIAQQHQANILGISVLDTPWLTATQPEPLGGSIFKVQHDIEAIKSTQSHIDEVMFSFKKECEKLKISAQAIEIEGFPANEIEMASYQGDLIIVGKTTDFHFDLDQDSDYTVKHIAHHNPRPLIVVPQIPQQTNNVLVAYDGTVSSSRALHMFLLLGLGKGKNLHIVHLNNNLEEGQEIIEGAVELCNTYQVKNESHIIQTNQSRPDAILELGKKIEAELIVLGAFGHTLLRETLFGSCSKTLLKNSPIPLFIHH